LKGKTNFALLAPSVPLWLIKPEPDDPILDYEIGSESEIALNLTLP
jgi:hypothetical protein